MDKDVNTPVPSDTPETSKEAFPWMTIIVMMLVAAASVTATIFILRGYRLPFLKRNIPEPSPTVQLTPTPEIVNTEGWKTYTDTAAGFSFKYPQTVILDGQDNDATKPVVHISVEKIADIPETLPMRMGRDDAIALQKTLTNGGEGTIRIGSLFGQTETTLSQFEVCSVMFSRRLTFFPGDYRVMVSVSGPVEEIEKTMPEFFTIDEKNCGQQMMWNRDVPVDFLTTVSQGKGRGVGQVWYDAFEGILKTIQITTPIVSSTPPLTATGTPTCDVSDNAFCNVMTDVKNMIAAKNYAGFLSYQTLISMPCDPDGMFTTICDGAAKGTIRQGYTIGYNESEGSIVPKDQYVATITNYIQTNGPFRYQGSLVSGDKAVGVFLNPKKDKILVFPMRRTGATWRMSFILLGGDFNGTYGALSPQILEVMQLPPV